MKALLAIFASVMVMSAVPAMAGQGGSGSRCVTGNSNDPNHCCSSHGCTEGGCDLVPCTVVSTAATGFSKNGVALTTSPGAEKALRANNLRTDSPVSPPAAQ